MSRILVTGAAGFIGSHTVDALLAEGASVLGVDDLSTGNLSNLFGASQSASFSLEQVDVSDEEAFAPIVEKFRPDAIVHLSALVSVPLAEKDPRKNQRLNVHATHIVAESARLSGTRRIVYASSAAVYGNAEESQLPLREDTPAAPAGQYGASKLAGETILHGYASSYGLSPVCYRYFNVFGPRQDPNSPYSGVVSIFLDRARAGAEPMVFGDGSQSRDFIFVRDIAAGNARAALDMELPAGIFNRSTGTSTTLHDLLNVLRANFPEFPPAQFRENRPGDVRHSLGDPSKAREMLGIEAVTSFDDGMTELIASV